MIDPLANAIGYVVMTTCSIAGTAWLFWWAVEITWERLKWGKQLIEFMHWKRKQRSKT